MLSNEHRTLVKATVPLLETGGETLTQHFYKMMLSEYRKFVRCSTRHTRPPGTSPARWPMAC